MHKVIDASTPTQAMTTTPRFDRIASDRWTYWEAAVLIWLQHQPAGTDLVTIHATHRRWLADLLARAIPLRVIRRLALDDPREPRSVLDERATRYTAERLRRATK